MTVQAAAASLAGSSSVSASLSLIVKLTSVPSTAGFAGITVDPTPYVYAAAQAILAAIVDASNVTKARAVLVMGTSPYVNIFGVAGSALAIRTGGVNSTLPTQYMASVIAPPGMSTTFATTLWSAVANYLFTNPTLLHADGFSATRIVTSDGATMLDMLS
jgi:hypothetical protein